MTVRITAVQDKFPIKDRGMCYGIDNESFPLGHVFKKGEEVLLGSRTVVVKEAQQSHFMSIDERTGVGAVGWCLIFEEDPDLQHME